MVQIIKLVKVKSKSANLEGMSAKHAETSLGRFLIWHL